MNPLFLPAVALSGYVVFKLWQRNCCAQGLTGKEKHDKKLVVLRHYGDPSDAQIDPLNLTSNVQNNKLIKSERGPNGCPRHIYEGPGKSEIPLYGMNYHIL